MSLNGPFCYHIVMTGIRLAFVNIPFQFQLSLDVISDVGTALQKKTSRKHDLIILKTTMRPHKELSVFLG